YGQGWTDAVTVSSEAARTGEYGIKMTTETTDDYLIGQSPVTVEPGKTYELSAWLKSEILASGKAQMKIEFWEDSSSSSDNHRGDVWSEEFSSYAEWENIKMQVEAPSDANI